MPDTMTRACPVCGSDETHLTPRGYAGTVDSPDQFITCRACGRVTYEILAVSQRDIRLHNYAAGGYLDRDGQRYRIRRVLKVGFNEHLLYVQRESETSPESGPTGGRRPANSSS